MVVKALGKLKPFCSIGNLEKANVLKALKRPLSGYVGGNPWGGYWCTKLERKWEAEFEVAHAIACNSATSGLLAACMAADIGFDDEVWVTDYSMSATAACAEILGAKLSFIDIDAHTYTLDPTWLVPVDNPPKALIVTNLFGAPAKLSYIRAWCDHHDVVMIEDNAQAPFASEKGRWAGTVGHMGVFSLNIHKHIQCGEGGVVVCHDGDLAMSLRDVINHGELRKDGKIGLNMRMTEITAAIACAQLERARWIVDWKRDVALALRRPLERHGALRVPAEDPTRIHVYYLWTLQAVDQNTLDKAMVVFKKYRFPIRRGYAPPLHTIFPHSGNECKMTTAVENHIMVYENCAHDPTEVQVRQMCDILRRVGDATS